MRSLQSLFSRTFDGSEELHHWWWKSISMLPELLNRIAQSRLMSRGLQLFSAQRRRDLRVNFSWILVCLAKQSVCGLSHVCLDASRCARDRVEGQLLSAFSPITKRARPSKGDRRGERRWRRALDSWERFRYTWRCCQKRRFSRGNRSALPCPSAHFNLTAAAVLRHTDSGRAWRPNPELPCWAAAAPLAASAYQ